MYLYIKVFDYYYNLKYMLSTSDGDVGKVFLMKKSDLPKFTKLI